MFSSCHRNSALVFSSILFAIIALLAATHAVAPDPLFTSDDYGSRQTVSAYCLAPPSCLALDAAFPESWYRVLGLPLLTTHTRAGVSGQVFVLAHSIPFRRRHLIAALHDITARQELVL